MKNFVKASTKGVLKIMSKMGISTVASYTGAQVFEAIGLSEELVDEYFTGTTSRISGVGLDVLAEEVAARHRFAYLARPEEAAHRDLWAGGEYQWRREGEHHLFNPETVFKLQHATRTKRYDIFKEYTSRVDDQARQLATLRGLFELRNGERGPVPIEEVEPVSEIVKRFSTGAMSYGSISMEAHQTLAIAMNRIGGKSNTGEGGEDPERLHDPERRSAIKQVASGRFGVTSEYLTNADDLQIKMAQGAKPGEGGQLPGGKVYPWIAKTRYSTPGVGLISPPPHHDIYSIEDLKQLIHDLKNANPAARVHVKLVAEVGVGTVAAGVSKAKADVVLISGHDGGTGASPLNSLKHAGAPWELGLAETQQTLLLNGLRDRIVVQTDGQMKTGRDVVIAALLGRRGVRLRHRAARRVRLHHDARLPPRHLPGGRGHAEPGAASALQRPAGVRGDVLRVHRRGGARAPRRPRLPVPRGGGRPGPVPRHAPRRRALEGERPRPVLRSSTSPTRRSSRTCSARAPRTTGSTSALDNELIRQAAPALDAGQPVQIDVAIKNTNRTVGTMLGHEVTKRYRGEGLPDDTIRINLTGSAGQSFGAFVPSGHHAAPRGRRQRLRRQGPLGRPDHRAPTGATPTRRFVAEDNIIAGNVMLYGATGGEAYVRGIVGERFCVRNSGATAVVEGVGDHGCEYMTGGRAVVLGPTGPELRRRDVRRHRLRPRPGRHVLPAAQRGDGRPRAPRPRRRRVARDRCSAPTSTSRARRWRRRLLQRWHSEVRRFKKVMPRDYKRVLEAARIAEESGLDVDEAIMAAAHG